MSKLNVLYNVMKTMKETDVLEGTIDIAATMDETNLATVNGDFLKNKAKGVFEKRVKVQMGDESFKFEHEGNTRMEGPMHGMGHARGGMMHGHPMHGMCGNGPKEKMGKMMMLIKALDKMQMQEMDDGRKLLSIRLEGNDIPKEMFKKYHAGMHQQHAIGHGQFCDHHEKMKKFFEKTALKNVNKETLTPELLEIKLFVAKDFKVYSKTVEAVLKGQDFDENDYTLNVQLNVELK